MKLASIHINRDSVFAWLSALLEELTDEQSFHASRVAAQIYKRLRPAINDYATWRFNGDGRSVKDPTNQFMRVLRDTWKPNDGGDRFALPPESYGATQGELPIMVVVTTDNSGTHFAYYSNERDTTKPAFGTIKLDLYDVEIAKDWRDMSQALQNTLSKVMHEPVHYHNIPRGGKRYMVMPSGRAKDLRALGNAGPAMRAKQDAQRAAAAGDPETAKRKQVEAYVNSLLYLAQAPEIEAHSQQFAMLYYREYRGRPYEHNLMVRLAEKLSQWSSRTNINSNAYGYFMIMPKPSWQAYRAKDGSFPFRRATAYMDHMMRVGVERLRQSGR